MTVERIHPKATVMLIFIAIFTCLPSCINLSNIFKIFFSLLTLSTAFLQKASGPGKNTLISFLSFCFIIIRNTKGSKSADARSILLNTVNSAEGLVLVVLCYQEQKGKLLLPVSCVTILSRPP